MEINDITLKLGEQSLLGEKKEASYHNLSDKKINIFFMPNTSGKSLIFNSLEHLFSYNKEAYIKKTNSDLEVEINFSLNGNNYLYRSNYYNTYKILKDGEEIKGFEETLEEYLGIYGEKLEYYGSERNSLHSINRFNFLDFGGIKDKENTNEIPFINSKYDGISKKFILAYVLGAEVDGGFFKLITEYEYKKDFIEKHKKKFDKYSEEIEQTSLIDNRLKGLFSNLEDNRIIYGDITIAIKELSLLRKEYIQAFGEDNKDEDYVFLNRELDKLEKDKENIKKDIINIRENIRGNKLIEGIDLVKTEKFKRKEIEEFDKYNKFKEDLKEIDKLKIENHILNNIDPYITDFKLFLVDLYNVFIDKAIQNKLVKKDELLEENNINFNENNLVIEAFFKTSEGMRKTLRILTFVGLHIFSKKNKTKCLDYSFYDSFIENIDYQYRDILFDSIFEFIDKKNLEVPKMFFFITKIEEKGNENSINKLYERHSKYVNLIDDIGIK